VIRGKAPVCKLAGCIRISVRDFTEPAATAVQVAVHLQHRLATLPASANISLLHALSMAGYDTPGHPIFMTNSPQQAKAPDRVCLSPWFSTKVRESAFFPSSSSRNG